MIGPGLRPAQRRDIDLYHLYFVLEPWCWMLEKLALDLERFLRCEGVLPQCVSGATPTCCHWASPVSLAWASKPLLRQKKAPGMVVGITST